MRNASLLLYAACMPLPCAALPCPALPCAALPCAARLHTPPLPPLHLRLQLRPLLFQAALQRGLHRLAGQRRRHPRLHL